jgi:hypothetical protein
MLLTSEKYEKDRQAYELARRHYSAEEGITEVIRFTRSGDFEVQPEEPIKLLEVNENTAPSGIMPIQFGPSPDGGITYSITIIEVTPGEYEQIKLGQLVLPPEWENDEPMPKAP